MSRRLSVPRPVVFLLGLLVVLPAARSRAHEGPPFPLLMDQRVGPRLVSIWADPDIGTGTFFVVIEPVEGRALPEGTTVRVAVQPVSGRLEEAVYDAEPQPVRYGERHMAEVQFDRGEMWHVRVLLDGPGGTGELTADVEATPDGTIGPIGMLVYLLPFLAIGFLWLKSVLYRRQAARQAPAAQSSMLC